MTQEKSIHCGTKVRAYSEIRARAARLASGLRELGLGPADRFAIVMRNDVEYIEATLAGASIGAVPVPINWHWTGDDLAHVLSDSECRLAFAHTDLLPAVRDRLPTGVPLVEVATPPYIVDAYGLEPQTLTGAHPEFEALIDAHEAAAATSTAPPQSVIYTSGTTGKAKGVLRDPSGPEGAERRIRLALETLALDATMSTMVTAPLYHAAPNNHALVATALGMDLYLLHKFNPQELLELIQREHLEHLQMVPTMFRRLLALPDEVRASYDVSSIKSIIHAGSQCPADLKEQMIGWLGPVINEYYGGTESGAIVKCSSAEALAHPGTVGRAMDGCGVRILDVDGATLPAGEQGVIYLKPRPGTANFTYIGLPEARAEIEVDGYITVGDMGYLDEGGYLYLTDRAKDMVISGGVNIYPAEIEACLHMMDGIADVAVFGVPDEDMGEKLVAHIELEPGVSLTAQQVREYVAGHLAKYKTPRAIVFDEALPRDDTGKLFKRRLRERYMTATQPK
ncbi:long-chain acyl-CoA synthetase [Antricoccus suffuscus]|uniref:Long-chain acyl-CoA synthetase n=1 Tax=Antricoccus suffuscus TaxID=1629062 RepID=A0A2T1A5P3_9ACTN|nr:AMP-binding protein [Antricoccus suffuscus]PRZ43921.1 long-chain acyl-CoA synthetase [Antricoccus suffuscus]